MTASRSRSQGKTPDGIVRAPVTTGGGFAARAPLLSRGFSMIHLLGVTRPLCRVNAVVEVELGQEKRLSCRSGRCSASRSAERLNVWEPTNTRARKAFDLVLLESVPLLATPRRLGDGVRDHPALELDRASRRSPAGVVT
jgi:hypothetical protein